MTLVCSAQRRNSKTARIQNKRVANNSIIFARIKFPKNYICLEIPKRVFGIHFLRFSSNIISTCKTEGQKIQGTKQSQLDSL